LRLDVFQSRRVLVTAMLGFSSGIPLLLTGALLAARLAYVGVDLKTIGALSMVALPYNFKWTWAPLLDRFRWPFLGRRRGWLIVFQLALIAAILFLGSVDPIGQPVLLGVAAVAVAFLSASQDVVVDAFNADSLRPEERAAGGSAYLIGYKAAMLWSGIAMMWLAAQVSAQTAYGVCAVAMGVGVTGTLIAAEPAEPDRRPTMLEAVWRPFWHLLRQRRIAIVLVFVALYRFAEILVLGMIYPFLKDVGHFTRNEVMLGYQVLGFGGTFVGGVIGGALVARLGVRRCLLGFGLAFGATNLLWAAVALTGHSLPLLLVATFLDQAAGAMGAGAFVAYLMSRVDRAVSATQYAMLTSLSSLGGRLLGFGSAVFVASYGWPWFWVATTLITLPALVLVPFLPDEP
jgi:PAT family beta-lactamase induction signal transducer AmpG